MLLDAREVNFCLVRLNANFKVLVEDSDGDFQPGICACFLNKFFDNFVISKDNALHGMMDMGKKAVFNRVPFGGVGRVMAYQNILSDGVCELQHLLLEGMVPIAVGPSRITEQKDDPCSGIVVDTKIVPPPQQVFGNKSGCFVAVADGDEALVALHVVNTVGDDLSRGKVLVIMVVDLHLPLHVALPCPVKVAQTFLFLAIHADDWTVQTHCEHQAENDLELQVPCSISAGGQVLAQFPVLEAHRAQFVLDLGVADWDSVLFLEKPGELLRLQVRPKYAAISRAARFVLVYQCFQQRGLFRGAGKKIFGRPQPAFGGPAEFAP